jgi:C6 transcription factor Pro1
MLPDEGDKFIEQTYGEPRQSFGEEALDTNFFDFSNGVPTLLPKVLIKLDDIDHRLFSYFIQFVLPSILSILEANKRSFTRTNLASATCTVV